MRTVTIIAGNSDNKLTQQEWSEFVNRLGHCVAIISCFQIEFSGEPPGSSLFQNHAWVFRVNPEVLDFLKKDVSAIRGEFRQESVALIVGEVEFV